MSAASWALQQAIYTALESDSTLNALVTTLRIYDEPPRDVEYPYLVLKEDTEAAWDTATDTGSAHTLQIDVWSQAGGRKEVKQIGDAVRSALQDADLAPDGQTLVLFAFQSATYARAEDGQTFCATLYFRALTEPSD